MSRDTKAIARQFIEEVVNTGNLERVPEFIAPGYVDHHNTSAQVTGIESVKEHIRAVRVTYPDLHITVEDQIAEADMVATRIIVRATHRVEWLGMKPTKQTSDDSCRKT